MKTFSKSSRNPQLPSDTVNQRLVNSGQGRDTNPLNRGQGWLCTQKGRTRVIRGWSVRHSCGKHGRKLGGVTDIKGLDAGGPRKLLVTLEDSLSERRPQAEGTRSPNGCKAQYLGGWLGPFRYRFAISPTITRGAEYVRIDQIRLNEYLRGVARIANPRHCVCVISLANTAYRLIFRRGFPVVVTIVVLDLDGN